MDVMEMLERLGHVEPVDPEVLTRTASALVAAVANESRDAAADVHTGPSESLALRRNGASGPRRLSIDVGPGVSDERRGADDAIVSGWSLRSPRRARHARVGSVLLAVTVVAVLVAVVLVAVFPGRSHTPSSTQLPTGSPSWRLVSTVIPPFQPLAAGGQTGLQCVTDDVCYSPGSGLHGDELYRTTDGGQSWHETAPIPMVLKEGGYSFSCSNAETCGVIDNPDHRALGQLATWAITTDGGVHWRRSTIPAPSGIPNAYAGNLVCADGPHCVVSASGSLTQGGARTGTFLSTSDGGRTWTQASAVPALPAGSVWTMTCTPDGSCLAVSLLNEDSRSGIVGLSSHDWGKTWVAGPMAPAPDGGILYASCGDASHCMLVFVGGPPSIPYLITSTSDAGLTWQSSGPPAGWLNMPTAVSCATGDDCWIAMSYYSSRNPAGAYSRPTIEETHDGGVSWSSIPLPVLKLPIADVLTLSCPPSGDGCMGIGNRQDHFLPPLNPKGKPKRLSGPLVVSNLPRASS